jgi:hypothetical protein
MKERSIFGCLIFFIQFTLLHNLANAQLFDNIAPQLGINHTVSTQLQFGGHGCGFYDFDNDGWDDITFVQETDSVILYRNNQGVFESIPSIAFQIGQIRQALWVDYDNDGDNDLFMTSTNGNSRLYRNDGNFNFSDVTVVAGISTAIANNFGVSFADYDLDGYLDFYLARYQQSGDFNNPSHVNALYKNNGDGTFSDVTLEAGVADSVQPSFMGIWIDINRNGLPDLYVINDRVLWGNSMYLNNGDGTFTDITATCGAEMFGEDPMGATFADYDNDGDLDIALSNGGPPTKPVRLYTNNGNETFYENAQQLGIWVFETFMCSWGGSWIDIDNDTYLDLYMTTGLLMPATGEARNYLFKSNSAMSFTDSPALFSGDHIAASYSVAKGDLDNDGYADLIVQNAKDYNSFIWKNNYGPETGNNYIKITLQGTLSNRMAIGTWISVYCQGYTYTHYTRCGESFISQDSQHHIFGLGNFQVIDSIVVDYPSGVSDVYYEVPVNQHLYLTETETLNFNLSNPVNSSNICISSNVVLTAPPFASYLWSTGETTQSIVVTQSGDFYLTAWNFEGFPYISDTLTYTVLPSPFVLHEVQHNLCFGAQNGSVQLEVFNANPNFQIVWSNGGSGMSLANLSAGNYSYVYSDPNGCSYSDAFTLNSGQEIFIFSEATPQTTFELGSLQVMALGGEPPFDIFLDGTPISNPTVLDSGTYVITVVDANGCEESQIIVVGYEDLSNLSEQYDIDVFVFPNPVVDNKLFFRGFEYNSILSITDLLGRSLKFEKCEMVNCIEVNQEVSGTFFINIMSQGVIKTLRVVFIE